MNPQQWQDTTPTNHPIWQAYFNWYDSLELRQKEWRNGTYSTFLQSTVHSDAFWKIFDAIRQTLQETK